MSRSNLIYLIFLGACGQAGTAGTNDATSPQRSGNTIAAFQMLGQYDWTSVTNFTFDRNPYDGSGTPPELLIQPLQQNGNKWTMNLSASKLTGASKSLLSRQMSGFDALKFDIKNQKSTDPAQSFEFKFGCQSTAVMKFETLFESRVLQNGLAIGTDTGAPTNPCPNTWQNGIMKVSGSESAYVNTKSVKFVPNADFSSILVTSEIDLLFTGQSSIGVTITMKFDRQKNPP